MIENKTNKTQPTFNIADEQKHIISELLRSLADAQINKNQSLRFECSKGIIFQILITLNDKEKLDLKLKEKRLKKVLGREVNEKEWCDVKRGENSDDVNKKIKIANKRCRKYEEDYLNDYEEKVMYLLEEKGFLSQKEKGEKELEGGS